MNVYEPYTNDTVLWLQKRKKERKKEKEKKKKEIIRI